jgi:hypothetical protein
VTDRIWGEQDKTILRQWEAERNALVGPTSTYYVLVRGAHVDPLYQEPVADPLYGGPSTGQLARHPDAFEYAGPYPVVVAVLFERTTGREEEVDEDGPEARFDGEVYVARDEWEAKVGATAPPKEGDVLFVSAEWWDVVLANSGGHVCDSEHYVGWKLMLKKRTRFEPNRKI